MKIHFAPNTRAVRIVWLFEELGLPYELKRFKRGDASMHTPEYRKVHPMSGVPAMEDGDVTISESGAIVEYVLARTCWRDMATGSRAATSWPASSAAPTS